MIIGGRNVEKNKEGVNSKHKTLVTVGRTDACSERVEAEGVDVASICYSF